MRAMDMQPFDLAELVPQPEQAGPADVSFSQACRLSDAGPAFSIRDDDGRLVFTGGFVELPNDSALVWSRIAALTPREMVRVTRMVRAVIDEADYRRITAHVRTGHAGGHGWLRRLGFRREGTMRELEPGMDFDLYSRLKGER
ncbi:hypothetical protein GCM10009075_37810 [Sphingomonas trueperi]